MNRKAPSSRPPFAGAASPRQACPEEEELFSQAMRGVDPLLRKGRAVIPAAPPKYRAVAAADPGRALRDLLEGRLEFSLIYSDEYMEGAVLGLDPAVLGRLRAGEFSAQAHLDLHGQNAEQAFESLSRFIKSSYLRGLRTVIVITGRGRNSPNGSGVLRPLLPEWLGRAPLKRMVLAFCTARATEGGPGAARVLLRKFRGKGKIVWDRLE
ncbi:MAG: Smr/MutS family protein [Deltaproteobacteria bacterium]|jgi:DNA-nicking Smr family endonuclease|nr:Smr/MutS family protein [Deltaproteobacteria bacterium]